MRKTFVIIFFISILFSCNTPKSLTQTTSNDSTENFIQINLHESFKIGETVGIEIINITDKPLTLFNPTETYIEILEGTQWRRLKILNCPCDAPCNAPPEEMNLLPLKSNLLKWDQKERWCGEKIEQADIRQTIVKEAIAGLYRIRIHFKLKEDNEQKRVYKEFSIIP